MEEFMIAPHYAHRLGQMAGHFKKTIAGGFGSFCREERVSFKNLKNQSYSY
jgi:hypothetical protein